MAINYFQRPNPLTPTVTPDVPAQVSNKLGSGLKTPLLLVGDRWMLENGVDKVKQDIYLCLATPVGRRLWQPDFGSMLPYLLFQPYNQTLRHELIIYSKVVLETWLKSITVLKVLIDDSQINQHFVHLIVVYLINGTNSEQRVTLALAMNDGVQLPANIFTIGGVPILAKV